MMDFPIGERVDDRMCPIWLERHLHVGGFRCPRCGSPARRLCRAQRHVPAYRCRGCEGDDTLLTETVFEQTRPRPAPLGLLRRGMTMGEPTARLAREWGGSRTPLHTLRQRLQVHLKEAAPVEVMVGTAFEADELYQHAGEHKHAPSPSC